MKEKILITVKTYPILSRKYAELVCTAGVNEKGEWRRIYPVPFRQLYDEQKYKKFQWIEADIEKSKSDNRPESYTFRNISSLQLIGEPLSTQNNWQARRDDFLNQVTIYKEKETLIKLAHDNKLSLVAFNPRQYLDFSIEPVNNREWDPRKLAELEQQKRQLRLFDDQETVARQLEVVRKLPYRFYYRFEDSHGKSSRLMIEDWEIGALFWNCLKGCDGDEKCALAKVREKYWKQFVQSGNHDLTLILGTTLEHHNKRAPNPFVIVGIFYPMRELQRKLF